MTSRYHYSFVVDCHGPYGYQSYLLARSLMEFGAVPPAAITANIVGSSKTIEESLSELGINIAHVAPFSDHPYCNKIQQLANLLSVDAEAVVLLDTDTFVTGPFLFPRNETIMGKMVDCPNPPFRILEEIYRIATIPLTPAVADIDPEPTALANFNGGLYVIPRRFIAPLYSKWRTWALWCLSNIGLFETWSNHVDQVSFALAVGDLNLPVSILPRIYNCPTNHGTAASTDQIPILLHYHRFMDSQLFLLPTGARNIDVAVALANDAVTRWRSAQFPNGLFWSARYALNPDLGSGVGSRGGHLTAKRELIRTLIRTLRVTSLLDIGGGDGTVLEGLALNIEHRAMDIAADARDIYLTRNPSASFAEGDISRSAPEFGAELAVCLDLVIHQQAKQAYRDAVRNSIQAGRVATLISGFDDTPVLKSSITYFHEPLLDTFDSLGEVTAIPLSAYRGLVAYLILAEPVSGHPRDIRSSSLKRAIPFVRDRLALIECVATSRRELGFFPNHTPRCIEYPWILTQIRGLGRSGLHVADLGAGVNVLPLLLHDDGHRVTTVDNHPIDRTGKPTHTWNEWGFLDYSQLRDGISSVHSSYEVFAPTEPFDVIYSVSVVEHLPAAVRREWISRAARHMPSGGRLLLTVDIMPMSRDLWIYSEAKLVEEPESHGNIDVLLDELSERGFLIDAVDTFDWLPGSRVGVALIVAQRH